MIRKITQVFKALKWQRQIRAAVSTQLSLLEGDSLFALGGLTEEEENALVSLVSTAGGQQENPGVIVEFGTLFGLTTLLLVHHKTLTQKVITVDNFSWNPFGLTPAMHRDFTMRILRSAILSERLELADMTSQMFRDKYHGKVPYMVFLDADHSYQAVKEEIMWAKKLGAEIICGHDYGNPSFGVTRAVDESFPEGVEVKGMVWWHKG
jgi:predicted O-methyltransferase YrrM